jgi:hypothetical protein
MPDINLLDFCRTCGERTKAKGFNTSQHNLQIALIATEVAEALENLTLPRDERISLLICKLLVWANDLEYYRRMSTHIYDNGAVRNMPALLEELADIQIRLASYIGGNGWTEQFIAALTAKMEKNQARPHKHGKGF